MLKKKHDRNMTLMKKIIKDINSTNLSLQKKNIFSQIIYVSNKHNIISSYKEKYMIKEPSRYKNFYLDMYESQNYLCLLNDISLISGYYEFSNDKENLIEAKLEYIPNPGFIINKDYEMEYINSNLQHPLSYYTSNYIRFDFDIDKESYKPLFHPCSHLHLGLDSNYRISLDKFPYYSEFV